MLRVAKLALHAEIVDAWESEPMVLVVGTVVVVVAEVEFALPEGAELGCSAITTVTITPRMTTTISVESIATPCSLLPVDSRRRRNCRAFSDVIGPTPQGVYAAVSMVERESMSRPQLR